MNTLPHAAPLPPAPAHIVADGQPAIGRYAGRIGSLDWSGLRGTHARPWWWQRLHHKRWQYIGIGSEDVFVGVAIVDLGWTGTAFAYVFDRRRQQLLADWTQDGLLGLQCHVSDAPLHGAQAWFRGPGARLSLAHVAAGDVLELRIATRALQLQATIALAQAAPMLLAVGPIAGGVAHATQKSSALPVSGWVAAGGQRLDLGQALASTDASNGLLARSTDWRWACGHSAALGFNLQQGYFGNQENALWLDGQLWPLGAAQFDFDPLLPMAPWRVRTQDGLLDLVFSPEGARQQNRNLGIAASYYVQPVGTFSGTVQAHAQAPVVQVRQLLGVTEDHRSRW